MAPEKPTSNSTNSRIWTPYFICLVAIMFMSYLCFHGLNSGTSVYIDIKGGSPALAGILAAVYSTTAAVLRIIMGPIIDRRGRTLVMMIGAASFALGALLVGVFQDTVALVVGRVFQGIGFGSLTTAAGAAAADILPKNRMGEGMGYYTLGNALSQAVGPALGLGLVMMNPPEIMYYVLAALAVGVFVLSLICNYEKHPERLDPNSAYRQRVEASAAKEPQAAAKKAQPNDQEGFTGLRRFFEPAAFAGAVPMMFMNASNSFSTFFVGLYGTTLGLINPGIYFTLCSVVMISIRASSKKFMDVVLPFRLVVISIGAGVVTMVMLLLAGESTFCFYIAGVLYGLALGFGLPVNQSVSIKNTPSNRWGVGNAMFWVASDVSVTCMSLVYGAVIAAWGFYVGIFLSMACEVLALISVFIFYPKWAKNQAAFDERRASQQ